MLLRCISIVETGAQSELGEWEISTVLKPIDGVVMFNKFMIVYYRN